MLSKVSEDYISNRAWLRAVAGEENVILRRVTALEFLQLFVGYGHEKEVDVYAQTTGKYDNFNYHIVDTFDGIEYDLYGNILCTTVNQAVNDMLSDLINADEQALAEALSKYYHSHRKSFDGLVIEPDNLERFNLIKEWAIEFYSEG